MTVRVSKTGLGLIFLAVVMLAGCSKTATSEKPQTSSSSSEPSAKSESAKPATKDSTSLEQLREGQDSTSSGPLKEILFDYDKYDLRADARETLKANAAWLKSNASERVEIEGHCDERGTNEYNLALGAKRAQAAKDFLVTLGIPAQRLSTISYGKELPVCRESTEDCWQKNRRDRFVIMTGRPSS